MLKTCMLPGPILLLYACSTSIFIEARQNPTTFDFERPTAICSMSRTAIRSRRLSIFDLQGVLPKSRTILPRGFIFPSFVLSCLKSATALANKFHKLKLENLECLCSMAYVIIYPACKSSTKTWSSGSAFSDHCDKSSRFTSNYA